MEIDETKEARLWELFSSNKNGWIWGFAWSSCWLSLEPWYKHGGKYIAKYFDKEYVYFGPVGEPRITSTRLYIGPLLIVKYQRQMNYNLEHENMADWEGGETGHTKESNNG